MNNIKCVAIILARGGSKEIPNKNLESINNKSLLEITINQIKQALNIDIFVSSDAENILDLASNLSCFTIKRPDSLSGDESLSEDAILHSIDFIEKNSNIEFNTILFPQLTSPLRNNKNFKEAFELYKNENYDSLFSSNDARDYLLWSKDQTGKLIEVNFKNKERIRRQEKDLQLIENGSFYIFDKDKFKIHKTRLFDSIGEYRMEPWQVFEIDNFDDLELCRHISRIKNVDGIYG